MSNVDPILAEFQNTFFAEADDLLESAEGLFLAFEQDPSDIHTIEKIFRFFHTIKGSAASVDFNDLSNFTHHVENLLCQIKEKTLEVSSEIIDILLNSNDLLRDYITKLRDDRSAKVDTSAIVAKIEKFRSGSQTKIQTSKAKDQVEDKHYGIFKAENTNHTVAPKAIVAKVESMNEQAINNNITVEDNPIKDSNNPTENKLDDTTTLDKPIVEEKNDHEDSKYKDIGTILLEKKLINQTQLDAAVQTQKSKLGEILVKQGSLATSDLDNALEVQRDCNKGQQKVQDYVKLPLSRINCLLDYFGEQVILQSVLEKSRTDLVKNQEVINKAIVQLAKVTGELQQTALSLRMDTLNSLFLKIRRVVRDVSKELGKNIKLETYGEETEIDKAILDDLYGAIMHVVRNSIDHGIETREEREAAGKSPEGAIRLRASQKGGLFLLEIEDDGKGLDHEKIRQKAEAKGLIPKNKVLTHEEIINFLFISGFSTKDKASAISGRGVGMDVVNDTIKRLKGTCQVESELGVGTRITIRLPLTLAMFKGTVLKIKDQRFVLPNSDYKETVSIPVEAIQRLNDGENIVKIKEKAVKLLYLYDFIDSNVAKSHDRSKIKTYQIITDDKITTQIVGFVASFDNQDFFVPVDEFISQERIVFKKLGNETQKFNWVSGGTILGDGNVALILDLSVIFGATKKVA